MTRKPPQTGDHAATVELVSTIAHELRTPVTSILGSIGLVLARPGELSQESKELLLIARGNCDRLIRLLDDMLQAAALESGRLPLRRAMLRVEECVGRALETLAQQAGERQVRVEVQAEDGVPDVYADPDRIEQVAVNLVSNAIKFSPPGSRVRVSINQTDEHVRVSVADEGPGLCDGDSERLFDKFYQGQAGRSGASGSGLGLAISRAIVEQHGGSIAARNGERKGAEFIFLLPIQPNRCSRNAGGTG